jgi:predicted nucleotidyltransferase
MDKDFKELLSIFNAHRVRYLIVGGFAVSYYSEPRATKDLDLFIASTPENATAVYRALAEFGAPLGDTTVEDFATPGTVYQLGVAPQRVDILQQIEGVNFESAWKSRVTATAEDGVEVFYISVEDLMINKSATGRPRDLLDVEDIQAALELKRKDESKRSDLEEEKKA